MSAPVVSVVWATPLHQDRNLVSASVLPVTTLPRIATGGRPSVVGHNTSSGPESAERSSGTTGTSPPVHPLASTKCCGPQHFARTGICRALQWYHWHQSPSSSIGIDQVLWAPTLHQDRNLLSAPVLPVATLPRSATGGHTTPPRPESAERSGGASGVGHTTPPRPESAERSGVKGRDTLTRLSPKPKHLGYPFTTARASLQKQHGLASPPYSRNPCPWLTTFSSTSAPFGARFN